ncbi:helix-turn-helix transcriptional regulator [Cohnella zeiphila]|uniref:Helix-turn-helix transcriptional regulator n=1 Tax=Cohnella zeiphila TaxID=2761120 RepID=A0A7X0VUA8_9BACL|nr:AraC family transcriptional regulator [Cohnella zeiphila]MBB6730195.1 helix-turn-helix transcriptional regulator [Cohnella zeiphila]
MNEDGTVLLQAPPLPYYLGAGRSDFKPGDQHPNRRNLGIYDLLLVVKGALPIGENGREWTLTEGETLLLFPEGEHYAAGPCDRETVFYWVHFEHGKEPGASEDAVRASRPFGNPHGVRIPKRSRLADPQAAFSLLRQLLAPASGGASFWQEQRLFAELLAMLEREGEGEAGSPSARLAERAAAYLRQNHRAELTNEALAQALLFHPNYVVRCMKAKYGRTPMDYLHDYRIEQAKRLLVATGWPVSRIAEEVGFRYAPYFSACFKRTVGQSPLQFRKQYLS